jgi:hypothetical protein
MPLAVQLYITKRGHAIHFPGRCVPAVIKDLTEKLDEDQVRMCGSTRPAMFSRRQSSLPLDILGVLERLRCFWNRRSVWSSRSGINQRKPPERRTEQPKRHRWSTLTL